MRVKQVRPPEWKPGLHGFDKGIGRSVPPPDDGPSRPARLEDESVPRYQARIYGLAAVAVVLIGVGLRLYAYFQNRPLWLDEAMLALNVATRSYAELLRPLAFDQWAPPLFLWLERFAVEMGGVSEATLRIVPLAAGISMVALCWPVARRFLGPRDATLATAVLALQLSLSRYATEVKPYGADAFVSMMLLGLLVWVVTGPNRRTSWFALAVGGAVALTLSHPAVFVMAGVIAALMLDGEIRRQRSSRLRIATVCLVWAAVFALVFSIEYTAGTRDPYLARYWEGSYLFRILKAERTWLRGAVFCVGLYALWTRGQRTAVVACAVPMLALGAAAALHVYPLTTRLLVFLAPISAIAYASALGFALSKAPPRWHLAAFGLLLTAMTVRQFVFAERYFAQTVNFEDSRDLARWVSEERRGEPVYVNGFGAPSWVFYTTDWMQPDTARLAWYESILSSKGVAFANRPSRGHDVVDEGFEIRYETRNGTDIVGVPTGMEYQNARGHLQPMPDNGWAANEISRVRLAASPFAWIFLSHYTDAQESALLAALDANGGSIIESSSRRGAAAYRICVPPAYDRSTATYELKTCRGS